MNNMIILLIIGLGVLVTLIVSAGELRRLYLGWRVPTTWISALPSQGWVEVLGRIRGEPIKSPFMKSDCVYWQLEIQEYQNSGRGGGRWRTIHRESSGSFMIDDMTGRIQVMDGKATMLTNNLTVTDTSDPEAVSFIESKGIKTTGILGFKKRLRMYERQVVPDEEILVLGKLQKTSTPVSIIGNDIVPLVISNQGRAETNRAILGQAVKPMFVSLVIVVSIVVFFLFANSS